MSKTQREVLIKLIFSLDWLQNLWSLVQNNVRDLVKKEKKEEEFQG
jgi:hypothetical protein